MILTVTLNAALDVTYHVPQLRPHRTHRVREVAERAGGKGVNVARVLHAIGEPVTATGLAGGGTGARIRSLLAADGVPESFVDIAAESRRTVAVADGVDATGFWEPGPLVSAAELATFRDHYRHLLAGARVVVLSGSLPRGVPVRTYADLVTVARDAGVAVVLDADGEPLRLGVAAAPTLVKPNAAELAGFAGVPVGEVDVPSAAEGLRAGGAAHVVASLGAGGMVAVTAEGRWRAAPPQAAAGNPTGAGDAAVAALARGLRQGTPWPQSLRDAVALSVAAVRAPVAGTVDLRVYREVRDHVAVTALDGP